MQSDNQKLAENQTVLQFGPIKAVITEQKVLTYLELDDSLKNRPWPLPFTLDVAEALDALWEEYPTRRLVLANWTATRTLCPLIVAKLSLQQKAWRKTGRYVTSPDLLLLAPGKLPGGQKRKSK